jgi:hypothetical protein
MDFYGGEEIPRQLFNADWKFREQALRNMEQICLEKYPNSDDNDIILMNLLRPVVLSMQDKIAIINHTALDICANVLQIRLRDMKKFNGNKEALNTKLDELFDSILVQSQNPQLKTSIFKNTARIVSHPLIG